MLAHHLQRILAWADTRVPGLRASMRPGASRERLRAIEHEIGAELPADVVELYQMHDGQHPLQDDAGLIYGFRLLPVDEALEDWAANQRLLAADPELQDDCAEFMVSFPPGAIEPRYIHPGWFPLTRDGHSNHVGVDLMPGPLGTRGQVIVFGRDEDEKLLLSASLTDFLGWYAGELERGNVIVEIDHDDPPIVLSFTIETPPLHFHDAARQLRRERGPFVA